MSNRSSRSGSTRLVARQVSELGFARWQRWQKCTPHERLVNVVVETVLSGSIAHLPIRDPRSGAYLGIDAHLSLARPVTATAISLSMGLPLTTVRRRTRELADAGVLVRDPEGFRVAPDIFSETALAEMATGDAADLMRGFAALAAAGYGPAIAAIERDVGALPPTVVARILQVFTLRSFETITTLYGDFIDGIIAGTVVAINIRHITDDPDLARYYAAEDRVPPDSERRPVALRVLARTLDIPFETVRRRVTAMVADGKMLWKDDGLVVPTHVLQSEAHREDNRRRQVHFEQMIATLIALRTDPGTAPA